MEYLDIVDEKGYPAGEIIPRESAHREGVRHRTAHVWIVRAENGRTEILLQKRSMGKESFPGMFDTSSAGHIPAGIDPLSSARRELREELGIDAAAEQLRFAGVFRNQYETRFRGRPFRDDEVTWVYVYSEPVDLRSLMLQPDEVDEVRWFAMEEVWEEIHSSRERFCVPVRGLEVLRRYLGMQENGSRKN